MFPVGSPDVRDRPGIFFVGPSFWEGISPLRAVDLLTNREPREREAQQDYWGGSRKIEDQQIAHLTNTSESDEDRHKRDARPSRHHDELQSGYAHFSSFRGIAEKAMPTSRRIGGRELLGLTAGDRCLYISGRGAS